MKKTEIILIALYLLSIVLKFIPAPLSNILFILVSSILATIYMMVGTPVLNNLTIKKTIEPQALQASQVISAMITSSAISVTLIGIMFYIQRWPGSTLFIFLGVFSLLIGIVISFFIIRNKFPTLFKNILIRSFIFGTLGLLCFFISTRQLVSIQYRNQPQIRDAYFDVFDHPGDSTYIQKLHELQGFQIPNEPNAH
jgi:hypothetical protein